MLKATGDREHPVVMAQRDQIIKQLEETTETGFQQHNNYSVGLGIIFLTAVDAEANKKPIQTLLDELLKRQKPHGGWGYPERASGDTSMTQYAVLGMWEASRAGFDIPVPVWEKVTNWLLRTQDPSGGFGYQAVDPESYSLVQQPEVRHSLTAGALASIYLCADNLGLVDATTTANRDNLPTALQPVKTTDTKSGVRKRRSNNIDTSRLAQALLMGKSWFDEKWAGKAPLYSNYLHYYLYALERYETFREAFGGPVEGHPWYDDGARMLLKSQQEAGSWFGTTGPITDTAFSVLFLVRSTRKSLGPSLLGSGAMVGGRGIPKTSGPLQVRGGDIVASPLKASADQLLSLMDNIDDPASLEAAEGFFELAETADEATLNKHALQLRKLTGNERPEARAAAVKAIGRIRDLDNVPTLIYALTDPDTRVVVAAVEALRFVSRQPAGSSGTVITDPTSRDAAVIYWKKWYRAIRPAADLSAIPQ